MGELKKTPLIDVYKEYGGKTIDFGGWELPVQFSGIKIEHEAVRTKAGLFDVSHMGEFTVKGTGSLPFLQLTMTNDISKLKIGRAQYSAMCYEDGGTVDDLIIYKMDEDDYLIVVNASNIDKDFAWLQKYAGEDVELKNRSEQIGQLAIQGPLAADILQDLTGDVDLDTIGFFAFRENVVINGISVLVSRTGYTGEDGFEIYCKSEDAVQLWKVLLESGESKGLVPCGLGARDTLRFEAKLPLYGQELSPEITPIEAGIGFAVKTEKAHFIGSEVLKEQKENGAPRKLVGIEMIDRGIPRHGYPVFVNDEKVGEVTTGTQSPTLKKNIGLALIKAEFACLEEVVDVEIRGKRLKAKIVSTPFYKRTQAGGVKK